MYQGTNFAHSEVNKIHVVLLSASVNKIFMHMHMCNTNIHAPKVEHNNSVLRYLENSVSRLELSTEGSCSIREDLKNEDTRSITLTKDVFWSVHPTHHS